MSNYRGGGNRGQALGRGQPRGGTASPTGSVRSGFQGGRGGGAGPIGAGLSGGAVFGGPASVDQRLATSNTLLQTLKTIPHNAERPTRPGFGTLGKAGVLRTNFFPVKFPKTGIIYDYHVAVTPKTDLKRIRSRLFALLEESTHSGWQEYVPFIAHDGNERLVSSKKLPQPLDIPVLFLEEGQTQPRKRDKTYTISISLTRELKASELDSFTNGDPKFRNYDFAPVVSAYNLVLQYHASRNGVRVGKNRYFFQFGGPLPLSTRVEARQGFFMSARPVYKELMVNVGVCMTAFYTPGNLADAILEFNRQSKGGMPRRFAQKLKVTTSHLSYKQTKQLKDIMTTTSRNTSFYCDEFKATLTVEQYFKKKYKIILKHPDLPVADISGPNAKHPIHVPPELCEIPLGQPFRGRLDDQQTTQMLRYACKRPVENAYTILNQGFPQLGLTPNNQKLSNFGLSIRPEMAGTPFRELPPPSVNYKDNRPLRVNNGSWNILDVKLQQGASVKSWWILAVKDDRAIFNGPSDPALIGLWKGFAAKCQRSGMGGINPDKPPNLVPVSLENPANDPGRQRSLGIIRQTIRANHEKFGSPSFVIVILSRRDNYIYPGIKRICDVELGIHTVHMLSNKVLGDPKKQDQYFSNVALKVNAKLGGMNHKIDDNSLKWLTKNKTMLVGMDVTHAGPGSIDGTPSIAAVVASVDSNFVQFPASLRCQEWRKEMITDLSDMMIERLKRYQEVSKVLPNRVYVFRDGVSEGQFDTVVNDELPKILDAFKRVNPKGGPQGKPYRPLLTIIICGKRHHARTFSPPNEFADKNGNTRPGTVIDQGITSVFDFDFYLQAHAGLQGHVKPTHYTVVYDESKLGADEVQQGINTASYMYARATRSVSLIPPAYYADLACERGRCYLNDFLVSEDKTTTTSKGKGKSKQDKEEERAKVFEAALKAWGNGVHPNLRGSMFYI